jgi:hypothetical protein
MIKVSSKFVPSAIGFVPPLSPACPPFVPGWRTPEIGASPAPADALRSDHMGGTEIEAYPHISSARSFIDFDDTSGLPAAPSPVVPTQEIPDVPPA